MYLANSNGTTLQVEDLTSKSSRLDAELQRKSKQLKEVAAIAADEAEKRKCAKEVIKSLTAQVGYEVAQFNSVFSIAFDALTIWCQIFHITSGCEETLYITNSSLIFETINSISWNLQS